MKNKKGILAKILSVLTVLALFAGMLPAYVAPTAQAAGETVVYNFKQSGSGDFVVGVYSNNTNSGRTDPTGKHTASDLNWDYYDMHTITGAWQYFQFRGYDFKMSLGSGDWVALELAAPAAGTYSPVLNYATYGNGRYKVYLLPASALTGSTIAAEIADNDYLIGNVNFKDADITTSTLKTVQLNNEKHILVFKNNDSSGSDACLYNLTLNADVTADSDIDTVKASIDKSVIMKDDTAQITLSDAKTLDGTAVSIDGATVTYTSSSDSVASVDANGVITANAVGNATITVTVVKGAGFATDSFDITVDAVLDYTETVKTYDIGAAADTDWADIGFAPDSQAEKDNIVRNWNPLYSPDYRGKTVGVWHGIKINTPNPGKYLARLDYYKHNTSGGKFNVHIIPSSVVSSETTLKADLDAAVKTGNYKKATYEALDTTLTTSVARVLSIPNVEIKSPVHYILFEMAEGSQSQYNWINDFTLNGKASALASIELNSQAQNVEVGSTVNVSIANAFGQNGNQIADLSAMSVSYASSDADVATVNENGIVTGIKAGSADITVTAVIDGETAYATAQVTVSNKPVVITNAAIFGDVSAYITKSGEFIAFSGIDTTNYKEVGFYIAKGDGSYQKYEVADGKVYKTINVSWEGGSKAVAVSDFFTKTTAGESAYIFFSGTTLDGATAVKFKPYAVPVEGAEVVGHEYSVTLS